ncbi:MAG TPA: ABC transporter ATP-binding protein [bacterium]|nr:ABC transporter ATP-binding protein [bacterium]
MARDAIEIDNISKTYASGFMGRKKKLVLEDVSLCVPEGGIFGVLGPNGAGKTTLLSLISNLISPDRGTIRVFGHDVVREPQYVRGMMNLCSGHPNFMWSMNVVENLSFYGMLYGIPKKKRREKIEELISMMELEEYRKTRYDELSTGTKQRVALAKSFITDPRILFLDEPTLGLDPNMAIKIRSIIRDIHAEKGITILLTTHYMKEVDELCGGVVFLREGRIVAEGSPEELKKKVEFKIAQPTMEDVFLELTQ